MLKLLLRTPHAHDAKYVIAVEVDTRKYTRACAASSIFYRYSDSCTVRAPCAYSRSRQQDLWPTAPHPGRWTHTTVTVFLSLRHSCSRYRSSCCVVSLVVLRPRVSLRVVRLQTIRVSSVVVVVVSNPSAALALATNLPVAVWLKPGMGPRCGQSYSPVPSSLTHFAGVPGSRCAGTSPLLL